MSAQKNDAKRVRQFHYRSSALETLGDIDLNGKTFAITGTTSGIGIETARALALKGAHIVMFNRNDKMSEDLKKRIVEEKPDAKIDYITCDLNSLQSVKTAAEEFLSKNWPLHSLILNAGVMDPATKMTSNNLEAHFGINHVAHFLLCRELIPVLRKSSPSRIVLVSSSSHSHTRIKSSSSSSEKVSLLSPVEPSEFFYKLYAYSKMCNILTAFKLHRDEFAVNGINTYALHPGVIKTDIHRNGGFFVNIFQFLAKPFMKTLEQGAATTVYCATNPEIAGVSGKYWSHCWDDEKGLDTSLARDVELQDALWKHTEAMIENTIGAYKTKV